MSTHVGYHVYLVACALGLAIFDLTFLQAEAISDPSITSAQVDTLLRCNTVNTFSFELTDLSTTSSNLHAPRCRPSVERTTGVCILAIFVLIWPVYFHETKDTLHSGRLTIEPLHKNQ